MEIEIFDSIKDIPSISKQQSWLDSVWTKEIKKRLAKLGQSKGYEVKDSQTSNEWLYDIVWLEKKDGFIVDCPMVMESEWGDSQKIEYDFNKLLLAKAKLRIIICQSRKVPIDIIT